ncbi:MAG TPA: hypothetical protein DHU16_00175 [Gammaproteobacteria bacterium]|nr:hypothetical protein [Gammaproteobacteria bacterium]|tara:strand:- start:252 stop:491 length:240 start_codon:yes stop_codon:yes gene_type:complete
MRQTFRYTMLTLSFALITYGLLAWQQINFSLTALTHFRTTELHPVLALILGLGLLTSTLAELIGAHHLVRGTKERYEAK